MSLLKNVYVPLLLLRVINAYSIQLTQRNNHENISELLDNLLRGYDNSVRPDFGGNSKPIFYRCNRILIGLKFQVHQLQLKWMLWLEVWDQSQKSIW